MTRLQAAARYAGWAFLPVLAFVGGVAGMVGIEELLRVAIVHERVALLAIPVLAMSILGTALFAIRCAFVRPRRSVP
jgi:hypothetical protein